MMYYNENCDCGEEENVHYHMDWPMKKEFKMAMLEKKEQILMSELEFLKKVKELVKKSSDKKKDD